MAALWWILCFSGVQYAGIPVRRCASCWRVEESAIPEYIRTLERQTAERERAGEYEHLIYADICRSPAEPTPTKYRKMLVATTRS